MSTVTKNVPYMANIAQIMMRRRALRRLIWDNAISERSLLHKCMKHVPTIDTIAYIEF